MTEEPQGYHEVKTFRLPTGNQVLILPPEWKPFGTLVINGYNMIVCRHWIRYDKHKDD